VTGSILTSLFAAHKDVNHKRNLPVCGFFTAVLMEKKRDEKRGREEIRFVCGGSDIYICVFFISAA